MRTRVSNHMLNTGHLRFGVSARLFNDEAKRILSLSEVTSVANFYGVIRSIKNRDLKSDVHSLFEKSETQLKLCKIRLSDAIQKKSGSVIKKDSIQNGTSLNESLNDISHKTLDFNIIVAQNEKESVNFLVDKIRAK